MAETYNLRDSNAWPVNAIEPAALVGDPGPVEPWPQYQPMPQRWPGPQASERTLRVYSLEQPGDLRLICPVCSGLMPHAVRGGSPKRSFWLTAIGTVVFPRLWPLLFCGRDEPRWLVCRGCGHAIPD